eukprot:TRINITY_DN33849_c0_g1_i1.p1 TRINITY_DN33849_c0_g1~~TRINITY_DN33849_c0_g1_i1.p1  ORF type:complete len:368 (-),score=55.90 TRINITY_DN33849_c0_g1_i1:40-1143(-)
MAPLPSSAAAAVQDPAEPQAKKPRESVCQALASNQIANCDQFIALDRVPTIDLRLWLEGTADEAASVVTDVRSAAEEAGFFFVRHHGVSDSVFRQLFEANRQYFELPQKEKEEVGSSKDYPYGYENSEVLTRSEDDSATTREAPRKDLKETFSICLGPDGDPHSSTVPTRWPRQPAGFATSLTAYYRACERVAQELVKIAARALQLEDDFFLKTLGQHVSALRVLHYPETRSAKLPTGTIRASPHTDYGLFTLLAAAGATDGLQLMKSDGSWLDVEIPQDCFIVNLGDMFARWTNDRWRSVRHRVAVTAGETGNRRLSAAFFLNPCPDALVRTLPTCVSPEHPDKYRDVKAGDYLMAKHFAAMGYKN